MAVSVQVKIYFTASATDVTADARLVTVKRGRSRELDIFTAGSCTIELFNRSRQYDPLNAAGPHYGSIRPRLRVVVTSESLGVFDGFIEEWEFGYDISGQSTATINCLDGLALLSQTALTAFTNPTDTPSQRIASVLARSEVNYAGATDFDAGLTVMQGDTVAAQTNTLNYLQQVQETDLGRLFINGSGTLEYRDRTQGVLQSPRIVFASLDDAVIGPAAKTGFILDDPARGLLDSGNTLWYDGADPTPIRADATGVATTVTQDATASFPSTSPPYVAPVMPFNGIDIDFTSQFLYTRVQATRAGGVTQSESDAAGVLTFGNRTLTKDGLLFNSDADADAYALYLSGLYGSPQVRVASHALILDGLSALHARYVKRLEIGKVVRTVWRPNDAGTPIDRNSIVEGIEHRIELERHTVTLRLTPLNRTGFILDDASRGLLDFSEVSY